MYVYIYIYIYILGLYGNRKFRFVSVREGKRNRKKPKFSVLQLFGFDFKIVNC